MIKKILLPSLLLGATALFGQTTPTLVSYQADTLCENTSGYAVFDLVVEDLDNDSTYILITAYDPSLFYSVTVIEPPTYDPGEPQRTFQLAVGTYFGVPVGLSITTIDIEMVGGGLDDFSGTAALQDIGVRSNPIVTLDFGSEVFCTNESAMDASAWTSPDGGYFYYNDGTVSTFFDPLTFYNDMGDGLVYEYTDAFGCSENYMMYPSVVNPPSVSVSPNSSSCGNADGSATAFVTGDNPPFDVYWTTGFSESTSGPSAISNLSSGNYYINVEDINGCKATGIAQIFDGDLDVTANVTDETCIDQTFDGAIDLDIFSTNGTVDYVFWNNGETTEDISGLRAGTYTVFVHTTTGCNGSFSFDVGALPALDVALDYTMPTDCFTAGTGSIEITSYGGSGAYSWNWSHGAVTEDVYSLPAGIYTCTITDAVTGCSMAWSKNVESFNGPYIGVDNLTPASCNQADGAIDVYVGSSSAIISTSWSSGHTTEDILNVPAGIYTLTATDASGCMGFMEIEIPLTKPYQPSICLLTVDTSLIYNMVVWEKDITQDIAGFNVYRETTTVGDFELVANRPYALESFYQDNIASPVDRSWRYYITTYDDCGTESFPSFVHKTIHVVANNSGGSAYNLFWDDYEGIGYTSVDLHRFDETNGWTTIATLPVSTNTYTDTPPVITGLDYLVTFNLTDPCESTKVQDHNSSRSNKSASAFMPGGSTASVMDDDLGYISVYPNPASEQITLHIDNPDMIQRYEIRDIHGRLVFSGDVFEHNTQIDLSQYEAGIYTVQLYADSKIITHKFVKR